VVIQMIQIDWDLLFRYCGGECTPEERTRFEAWLAADASHRAFFDAVARGAARSLHTSASDAEAAHDPPSLRLPKRKASVRSRAARYRYGFVLTASGALAAGLLIVAGRSGLLGRLSRAGARSVPMRTLSARPGERAELRLADGTRITLAPASTIRYAVGEGFRLRDVTLRGEALFVVAHDGARALVVRANGAVIRDLGTTFDVRAYPGEKGAQVIVSEGRVALGAAAGSIGRQADRTLGAGELGRIDDRGVIAVDRVDPGRYTAWVRGQLVFDRATLGEVAAQVSRWYGTPVVLRDSSLASLDFTGTFDDGERLRDVLAVVAAAVHVRVEWHDTMAVLLPQQRSR
jgi:transmembrane sensor